MWTTDDAGLVRPMATRHYRKAIAYNSALISSSGYALYTPTVGDVLMDVWVEITTAWDGTTPRFDVGTGVGVNVGLFGNTYGSVVAVAATDEGGGTGTRTTGAGGFGPSSLQAFAGYNGGKATYATFTAANPLLIWVTQDGLQGGASPGASAGAGFVHLFVSTPIDL
jgi:hypothetical protein